MWALYAISAVPVMIQGALLAQQNNFLIFRWSFGHLISGHDLYAFDTAHYADQFKYSPTFALLFAPLAAIPFAPALLIWCIVNALALAFALTLLLPRRAAAVALAITYLEMVGAMQNGQSNSLVASTVILAFIAFEREESLLGGALASLGAVIKIYPLAALATAIPRRTTLRAIGATVLSLVILLALPAAFTPGGFAGLAAQYRSWHAIELLDAATPEGRPYGMLGGLMQMVRVWLDVRLPNWPIQMAGTAILLLPLALRRSAWSDPRFRLSFLASLLVYVLLFNHQAEPPSFVVGIAGIAIWYAAGPMTRVRTIFTLGVVAAVSLPGTSIFGAHFYKDIFIRYSLKTFPVAVAWCVMEFELLTGKEAIVISPWWSRARTAGDLSAASSRSRS